jgi:hypothetical protein
MSQPPHSPRRDNYDYSWWTVQIMQIVVMQCSPPSRHFFPLRPKRLYHLSPIMLVSTAHGGYLEYSEILIYHSWTYRFPGCIVQYLCSLNKSYLKDGLNIYRFPIAIVLAQNRQQRRRIEDSPYVIHVL